MDDILEFLRVPVVVTSIACLVGIGAGLGHESGSPSALWGSAGAVLLSGLIFAALAPDATLAPSLVVMGFSVTAVLRDSRRRRRSRRAAGDT
ncbi:hypothetical protein ACIPVB_02065 [Microbacterium sp. NPDC090007]|uniref:hypothetical protein n=1 Tax=Microbacterium sp. NPDC090007 TaxID=3364204 RepID=UPI00381F12A2